MRRDAGGLDKTEVQSNLLQRYGLHSAEHLAKGVTGTVFRVEWRSGEVCAAKVVDEALHDAVAEVDFLRACIGREDIVQLRTCFNGAEGFAVIVLELLSTTLSDYIKLHQDTLGAGVAMTKTRGVLSALAYLHSLPIIHADIKPDNIMQDASGAVKLVDFSHSRRGVLCDTCGSLGTLWYRSPEMLLGARFFSAAVDVFACGAVFFELLVGTPAFAGDSRIGTLFLIYKRCGTPQSNSACARLPYFSSRHPRFPLPPHTLDEEIISQKLNSSERQFILAMLRLDCQLRLPAAELAQMCVPSGVAA